MRPCPYQRVSARHHRHLQSRINRGNAARRTCLDITNEILASVLWLRSLAAIFVIGEIIAIDGCYVAR